MRLGCLVCTLCVVLAAAGGGCASTPASAPPIAGSRPSDEARAAAAGAINDSCPITTDSIDPAKTASWRGVTIGFCCDSCVREFREADEKTRDEILAKARAGK